MLSAMIGVALDTETTGLDSTRDCIMEIGLQLFRFNENGGNGVEVLDSYTSLGDPGVPISFEVQCVTGITPAMVAGQSIDWARVDALLAQADVILAHNAAFDRGFVDRVSQVSGSKLWACTSMQIDWRAKGFKNARLQDLCGALGIVYNAHRAMSDVEAMLKLISLEDVMTGKPYLAELWVNCTREMAWVWLEGETFDQKDGIKAAGFRWNGAQKIWGKLVQPDDEGKQVELFQSLFPNLQVRSRRVPPQERFKGV
jgi:DNA polymerase-3 subunit epsilon